MRSILGALSASLLLAPIILQPHPAKALAGPGNAWESLASTRFGGSSATSGSPTPLFPQLTGVNYWQFKNSAGAVLWYSNQAPLSDAYIKQHYGLVPSTKGGYTFQEGKKVDSVPVHGVHYP